MSHDYSRTRASPAMTEDYTPTENNSVLEDTSKLTEQVWWRDFVVEILGSILPGIVYTIFLSLLIVLVVHALHTTIELRVVPAFPPPRDQPVSSLVTKELQGAEERPASVTEDGREAPAPAGSAARRDLHPIVRIAGGSPVLATLFVLFVGCLVGMINMRRNIDDLDRRSLVHVRDHQLVGEEARGNWVARNRAEWQFPYGNLRNFLDRNGYSHLAWLVHWEGTDTLDSNAILGGRWFARFWRKLLGLEYLRAVLARLGLQPIPWTPAQNTREGFGELRIRQKYYVDDLKFRVLKHCPRFFPSLIKLEAHVRFLATTWRLSEWLMKLSRILFLAIATGLFVGWASRWLINAREFVLWLQAAGAAFLLMNFGNVCIGVVKRVLHPSRVREVIFILSAVHIACQRRREFAEGLAHDYKLRLPENFESNWPARMPLAGSMSPKTSPPPKPPEPTP